jgi:tetratricopeptide (TPR) repeat protein
MKMIFLSAVVAGVCAVSAVNASPIEAKIIMPGDRVWEGFITGRDPNDNEMLKFKRSLNTQEIYVGVTTVEQIEFRHGIRAQVIDAQMEAREFDLLIEQLNKALEPFAAYSDVPSNLTEYRFLLMKLYYWTKQFDAAVETAEAIADLIKDEDIAQQNRVFRALALIQSGQEERVKKLLAESEAKEESAETLYIQARVKQMRREYQDALKLAARIVALYSQDQNWMAPAELLCAELYHQTGMYESSVQVLEQFLLLYVNTPEYEEAEKLLQVVRPKVPAQDTVSQE